MVRNDRGGDIMKRLIIMLTAIFLLASCDGSPDNYTLSEITIRSVANVLVGVAPCRPLLNAETPRQTTWQEAYTNILQSHLTLNNDSYFLNFLLHDIDKDGIPELITIIAYAPEGFVIDYKEAVFTFKNDEAMSLEYGDGVHIAAFFSAARFYVNAMPDNRPGLSTHLVGPSAGAFGTSVSFWQIVIDGNKLVIGAYGERYVDV